MKPTKHATTNYRMFAPFLKAVDASEDKYLKFTAGGYMPLCVEKLYYTEHGLPVYSMTHYGELNGDAMRDPDMEFTVDKVNGRIDPLTYRNDYMHINHAVYVHRPNGDEAFRPHLRVSLDQFLWQWLKNIQDQGFDPAVYAE